MYETFLVFSPVYSTTPSYGSMQGGVIPSSLLSKLHNIMYIKHGPFCQHRLQYPGRKETANIFSGVHITVLHWNTRMSWDARKLIRNCKGSRCSVGRKVIDGKVARFHKKREKTIDSSNYYQKKLLWQHMWQTAWMVKQSMAEITVPSLFRIYNIFILLSAAKIRMTIANYLGILRMGQNGSEARQFL